jgi:hypothetical protein
MSKISSATITGGDQGLAREKCRKSGDLRAIAEKTRALPRWSRSKSLGLLLS